MENLPTVAYFIPDIHTTIDNLRTSSNERCCVFCLSHSLQVINTIFFTSHTVDMIAINPLELTQALSPKTSYLVLIHNHPSQTITPSRADYNTTNRLVSIASLLNFIVLDHIIVTATEYFSFAESGILEDIKIPFV